MGPPQLLSPPVTVNQSPSCRPLELSLNRPPVVSATANADKNISSFFSILWRLRASPPIPQAELPKKACLFSL